MVGIHTHIFPLEVVDFIRSGRGPRTIRVDDRDGKESLIVHANGLAYPVSSAFHDPASKLEQMDTDGIDVSVVSVASSLFLYELDLDESERFHRSVNDAAAAYAEADGNRLVAMANVPMNHPEAAAAELRRAHGLGLRGIHIDTSSPLRFHALWSGWQWARKTMSMSSGSRPTPARAPSRDPGPVPTLRTGWGSAPNPVSGIMLRSPERTRTPP